MHEENQPSIHEEAQQSIDGRRFVRFYADIEVEITDPKAVQAADMAPLRSEDGQITDLIVATPAVAAASQITQKLYEGIEAIPGLKPVAGGFNPGHIVDGLWHSMNIALGVIPARRNDGTTPGFD